MLAALQQKDWDLILADYARPRFNGIEALQLLVHQGLKIPLVIIAETPDEDLYRNGEFRKERKEAVAVVKNYPVPLP
jgi:CheY-like chemotaxis protein